MERWSSEAEGVRVSVRPISVLSNQSVECVFERTVLGLDRPKCSSDRLKCVRREHDVSSTSVCQMSKGSDRTIWWDRWIRSADRWIRSMSIYRGRKNHSHYPILSSSRAFEQFRGFLAFFRDLGTSRELLDL